MTRPTTTAVGLVLWLVQPLALVAELATATQVQVPYSLLDNTISDLGATTCTDVAYPYGPVAVCSPWHGLMNGSFVVLGLLLAVGAVLARRVLAPGRRRTVAVAAWVVTGLASVATGLVPLDVDLELHYLVSLPAFLSQPLALLLTGLLLRRAHPHLGGAGVALGVLTLAVGVVFTLLVSGSHGGGLLERAILWPATLWTGAAAVVLLRSSRDPRASDRTPG